MKDVIISPSILGADFLHLADEVEKIKSLGCKWIHFDVMDGHFVHNSSFGNLFLKNVNRSSLIKDVHIMVSNPLFVIKEFADAGANYLTFHYEACKSDKEVMEVITQIHAHNMKAGISIKPDTPVETILPFLKYVDIVLIMSVEPGLGGQKFLASALDKIAAVKQRADEEKLDLLISVDGGINNITAKKCLESGANVLVVGQYLFGHADYVERFQKLFQ